MLSLDGPHQIQSHVWASLKSVQMQTEDLDLVHNNLWTQVSSFAGLIQHKSWTVAQLPGRKNIYSQYCLHVTNFCRATQVEQDIGNIGPHLKRIANITGNCYSNFRLGFWYHAVNHHFWFWLPQWCNTLFLWNFGPLSLKTEISNSLHQLDEMFNS